MTKSNLKKPPKVSESKKQDFIQGAEANANKSTNKQTNKTISQQDDKSTSKRSKSLTGFYLAPETVMRLEMARLQILSLTGGRKSDVSKSTIVEAALKLVLDDLDQKGVKSELVKSFTP